MTKTQTYIVNTLQIKNYSYQPSLSGAFTSQPNSTRNLTTSNCPAHMALWRAVIPSSLAALGFITYNKYSSKVTGSTVVKYFFNTSEKFHIN